MKTIYKYPLSITDYQTVKMPVRSKILTVQVQSGHLFLWAMINSCEGNMAEYPVWIFGTGHEITEPEATIRYVSTVQFDSGHLVFHVFVGAED
jgi:hypothetical protein